MDLLLRWMMVLFTTPLDVELSVQTGDGGFPQHILMSVWRTGIISLSVMYSAPSSCSEADGIINLMIWAIVRTALLHLGVGVSSDKNVWSPARHRAFDLLLNPVSERAARTMSLDQYVIP